MKQDILIVISFLVMLFMSMSFISMFHYYNQKNLEDKIQSLCKKYNDTSYICKDVEKD